MGVGRYVTPAGVPSTGSSVLRRFSLGTLAEGGGEGIFGISIFVITRVGEEERTNGVGTLFDTEDTGTFTIRFISPRLLGVGIAFVSFPSGVLKLCSSPASSTIKTLGK